MRIVILILKSTGCAVAADGYVSTEDLTFPPFMILGKDFGDSEGRRTSIFSLGVRRGMVFLHVGLL